MYKSNFFNKKDIYIIISLLIISFIIYYLYNYIFAQYDTVYAEICINAKEKETILLDENKIFSVKSNPHVKFEIKDNKIRFLESDCPDKICVNTGFIGIAGQTAVCLPNKISLTIKSNKPDNDFDAVS